MVVVGTLLRKLQCRKKILLQKSAIKHVFSLYRCCRYLWSTKVHPQKHNLFIYELCRNDEAATLWLQLDAASHLPVND